MRISQLQLQQFKNYENETFEFHPRLNVITGLNGMGKTNVFDALHYLSFTKSAFNSMDALNVMHERDYFSIVGKFQAEEPLETICYFHKQTGKNIQVDESNLEKIGEHIGRIPLILSTPYDQALILDGSEARRKFIDGTISQFDGEFLAVLLKYQRVLKQRNACLKNAKTMSKSSLNALLDVYDEEIVRFSKEISLKRKGLVDMLFPFFTLNYSDISGTREEAGLSLKSQVQDKEFHKEYANNREKDIIMQRTSMGCHRDDFIFTLNNHPLKKEGSQGQQKSYLLSLKLAQFDLLKSKSSVPILLLDDLFDKLDDERIQHILHILGNNDRFQQVFISDARVERISALFAETTDLKFFEIEEGELVRK